MAHYVVFDPDTGELVRWGECQDVDLPPLANAIDGSGTRATHYVANGELVAYTPEQAAAKAAQPSLWHRWSNTSMGWADSRDLEAVRATKLAELKGARDAQINGGFEWGGLRFDSDETAQMRLMGLFVASQGPGFTSKTWRLQDNTWHSLTAADAAGVWSALEAHLEGAFTTFAAVESQALAATTIPDVEAITWPT